jgi:hypothetical protein
MVNRIGARQRGVSAALLRVRKIRFLMALLVVPIASLATTVSSASADTLIGNASVQSGTDSNDDGVAEAFPFTASASGNATGASVFIDSDSTATGIVVGLYSDSGGAPGTLLGQGSRSSPISEGWNTLSFPGLSISVGTRYWLAILGTGGRLKFRDDSTDGSCQQSVTSDATSVIPPSFGASWWDTCNVSAYLSGVDPVPPSLVSVPTISGDFSYHGSGESGWGGTVTATIGTWKSSDPPTYSFQWQECDSSGDNCSNVPPMGSTPDNYWITPSEVGKTIRVAVTATNQYGSTTAYSDASPVITGS